MVNGEVPALPTASPSAHEPVSMPPPRRKKQRKGNPGSPHPAPEVMAARPQRAALPGRLDGALGKVPLRPRRKPQVPRAGALGATPFRNELIEWELREEKSG